MNRRKRAAFELGHCFEQRLRACLKSLEVREADKFNSVGSIPT